MTASILDSSKLLFNVFLNEPKNQIFRHSFNVTVRLHARPIKRLSNINYCTNLFHLLMSMANLNYNLHTACRPVTMERLLLLLCLLMLVSINAVQAQKTCKDTDGKKFKVCAFLIPTTNHANCQVGESYGEKCDVFTCSKHGKKYKFVKSMNETHCCKHGKDTYRVGDMFNSTKLNYTCSTRQLKCVNGELRM